MVDWKELLKENKIWYIDKKVLLRDRSMGSCRSWYNNLYIHERVYIKNYIYTNAIDITIVINERNRYIDLYIHERNWYTELYIYERNCYLVLYIQSVYMMHYIYSSIELAPKARNKGNGSIRKSHIENLDVSAEISICYYLSFIALIDYIVRPAKTPYNLLSL